MKKHINHLLTKEQCWHLFILNCGQRVIANSKIEPHSCIVIGGRREYLDDGDFAGVINLKGEFWDGTPYEPFCLEPRGELTLLKKSTGQITDEDANELGQFHHLYHLEHPVHAIDFGRNLANQFLYNNKCSEHYRYNKVLLIAEFLRLKGYALPYGPYSVDQLVEAGIYKLIG